MKNTKNNGLMQGIKFCILLLIASFIGFAANDYINGALDAGQMLAGAPIILMAVTFGDLQHDDLANNMPGLKTKLILFRFSDLRNGVFPVPNLTDPSGSGALADLVTVDENIYFKTGKGPIEIYVTAETSGLNSKLQGDLDNKSFRNEIKGFIPTHGASVLGFIAAAKNADLGVVVEDMSGNRRLIGCPTYPAKLADAEAMTGEQPTGKKGVSFTIYDNAAYPAPIWTGKFSVASYSGAVQDDYPTLFA